MNYRISDIFREANDRDVRDDSWDHMKYYAKAVPEWWKTVKNENIPAGTGADWLKEARYDGGDFIKWLEKTMDPDISGFKHVKISSLPGMTG